MHLLDQFVEPQEHTVDHTFEYTRRMSCCPAACSHQQKERCLSPLCFGRGGGRGEILDGFGTVG